MDKQSDLYAPGWCGPLRTMPGYSAWLTPQFVDIKTPSGTTRRIPRTLPVVCNGKMDNGLVRKGFKR